ncbi:uncharacterized protein RHO17_005122 isoform 4-T4 [Thomomys bottae]
MHKIEIQHSKEFCVERITHRETQQYEPSKTVDSMKEAIEGISLVIAHTQSLAHTPVTRTRSEGSSMENLPRDAELKGSFPPRENHVTSSSNAYTSVESLDQYLSRILCLLSSSHL